MANVKNNASSQETRRKLIDAAGKIFAEKGFHAATIKEITDQAGVNLASINYHFTDKAELYAAVIRHAVSLTPCTLPEEPSESTPEARLRALVVHALHDFHDPGRPAWRATLLSHELNQPTAAMDAILDELIWPRVRFARGLIRDILGPKATDEEVAQGTFSVTAQVVHYLYNAGLLRRLNPDLLAAENVARLADHITQFSLAGLYAMRDRGRKKGSRRRP
ncbi:MAG TPA: CerR family C-terminal domain-containing protein [Phycisphaerae bacterium]|jgi:AcrR family transcriptional regulator|nr:helix-turn-helix transcriptional regulator [Phycisphaerae bacterium]HOB74033.1 CerR family C-terminal domain-containing protein [Phycisphaerae bacterium]HOJ53836.1 CerR family C-terminal domain-containing protein [Phycisphaerae bacterium]HOL26167.1 CerR family C-terminal domain-containing protein [Phycisphaerae bacterium]HPP20154.1 CerR family C-terminal domain-containing protein [Phycisphaerae bacterium]